VGYFYFGVDTVITSAVALGGTVAGFQPASGTTLIVFDRVTVRAAAAN
jgi:hypothetical protein